MNLFAYNNTMYAGIYIELQGVWLAIHSVSTNSPVFFLADKEIILLPVGVPVLRHRPGSDGRRGKC